MSFARLQVTSEIYAETDFDCSDIGDGKSVSKFTFTYPPSAKEDNGVSKDKDGDLLVERRRKAAIEIEHSTSTDLTLVGLQVWRGALLLADYIFHNRKQFNGKNVLEMGSGVGLTGVAAAMYSQKVICTDIDLGGILNLIEANVKRNSKLITNHMSVMELDFKNLNWPNALQTAIDKTDIVLAADVIYDDDLTDGLIATIEKILAPPAKRCIYIALEKRYVFTVADLESLAPCYEYFLTGIEKLRHRKGWSLVSIPIDFPQYFQYERVKELVLLKLSV